MALHEFKKAGKGQTDGHTVLINAPNIRCDDITLCIIQYRYLMFRAKTKKHCLMISSHVEISRKWFESLDIYLKQEKARQQVCYNVVLVKT